MNTEQEQTFKELVAKGFKSESVERLTHITLNQKHIELLLSINNNNIPASSHKVSNYAAHMEKGLWKYNGDSIRIGKSGVLLDGQNRLLAALESKCDLVTDLCYGLEDDVFNTIDVGRVRNNGHLVFRAFDELEKPSDGSMISRAVKKIILHDAGYSQNAAYHKISGQKLLINDSLLIEYIKKHPIILQQLKYVRESFNSDSVIPRATILYVYHIGSRFDDAYAKAFIDMAFGGENLHRDEACYHLYNFLRRVKQKSLRWTPAEIDNSIIKVWNIVAKKGRYKIKNPNSIKVKEGEKNYTMNRPDENIRDSVKCHSM